MPEAAASALAVRKILELVFRRSARNEIPLDHAFAVDIENFGIGKAAHQRLAHRGQIGAAPGGEMQGFGDPDHGGADNDLIGELGHLPGANRTDVGDAPHRREYIGDVADHVARRHPP